MGKPVVHFEIASANADKVKEFYKNIFGWKIDDNNPIHYGMVDTASGGIGINGGLYQVEPGQSPGMLIYAAVEDTDVCLRQVVSQGGRVIKPTEVVPGMVTFALFADPDGNVMGIVKNEMPQQASKKSTAKKSVSSKPKASKKKSKPAKKGKKR